MVRIGTGRRRQAFWLGFSLCVLLQASVAARGQAPAKKVPEKLPWDAVPYVTISRKMPDDVRALPVCGTVEWAREKMPFVADGPAAGISGAAFVHHAGALYLVGGFIPAGDETTDAQRRTSRWAYRYNLDKQTWDRLADLPARREYTRGAVHGDAVYVVGGGMQKGPTGGFDAYGDCFRWQGAGSAAAWKLLDQLKVPRTHMAVGVVGNYLIAAGGNEYKYNPPASSLAAATIRDTTEVLDLSQPDSGWQQRAPIPGGARGWCASAANGEAFYVFGGLTMVEDQQTTPPRQVRRKLQQTYCYDPRNDRWREAAPFPLPISGWEAERFSDRYILLAGGVALAADGRGNHWNDMLFVYDAKEDRWLRLDGPLPTGGVLNDTGVCIVGDTIYVAGGEGPRGSHWNHLLVGKVRIHEDRP